MRAFWHDLGFVGRLIVLAAAIAAFILATLALLPTPVRADGYEGSAKDIGGYSTYRHEPVSYRRGDVREYLTAAERRELKRIHSRAVARRDGRRIARDYDDRPRRRYARYYDEPSPVRYVERRTGPSSFYVRSGDKECRAPIKAVSEERGWQARALNDAISKWRAAAIAEYGYAYGQYNASRADRPNCGAIRTNKFGKDIWVCSIRARPCKDL